MSTSTVERQTTERPVSTWTCPNCRTETETARKRCADCKTSRY